MGEYDDLLGRGEYREPSRDELLAQVKALTSERDFERSRCASLAKTADAYMAERDAARAELAAANARCAEVEQKVAYLQKRLEVTRETIHRQSEAQGFDGLLDQRDALQATLDRVTALTPRVLWSLERGGNPALAVKDADLRAALTPEGTE